MHLFVLGDICLGRHIKEKYEQSKGWQFVSDSVIEKFRVSKGKVIANLESPLSDLFDNQNTQFCGNPSMLEQFRWIDCFSLANNHINDFGEEAVLSTMESLDELGISHNGIYDGKYEPYIIEENNCKIAVFCSAAKVGEPFDEHSQCHLLYNTDAVLYTSIKEYKKKGYLVIVYSHMGSMFCRYPNVNVINITHKMIDAGCDCVVSSHPHCIGGLYMYKNTPVFYSLGDFLMDGSSFRRRRSYIVKLDIQNNKINKWDILPTVTTINLEVKFPEKRVGRNILNSISKVSQNMSKERKNYESFYKTQYRLDMIRHSMSTLQFVYHTEGFSALISNVIGRLHDFKDIIFRFKNGASSQMLKEESKNGHLDKQIFKKK